MEAKAGDIALERVTKHHRTATKMSELLRSVNTSSAMSFITLQGAIYFILGSHSYCTWLCRGTLIHPMLTWKATLRMTIGNGNTGGNNDGETLMITVVHPEEDLTSPHAVGTNK